jgi:hypothetical protein
VKGAHGEPPNGILQFCKKRQPLADGPSSILNIIFQNNKSKIKQPDWPNDFLLEKSEHTLNV